MSIETVPDAILDAWDTVLPSLVSMLDAVDGHYNWSVLVGLLFGLALLGAVLRRVWR